MTAKKKTKPDKPKKEAIVKSDPAPQNYPKDDWTGAQLIAIGLLADIDKKKTFTDIAIEAGVGRKTLWEWRQKTEFIQAVADIRNINTAWKTTPLLNTLYDKAIKGDMVAMKMALQLNGELSDGKDTTVNLNIPIRDLTPKELKDYRDEFDEEY